MLSIRNTSGRLTQVNVVFLENSHVIDSHTYRALAIGSMYIVDPRQIFQELIERFAGVAAVYADQPIVLSVIHHPLSCDTFLPPVLNNR